MGYKSFTITFRALPSENAERYADEGVIIAKDADTLRQALRKPRFSVTPEHNSFRLEMPIRLVYRGDLLTMYSDALLPDCLENYETIGGEFRILQKSLTKEEILWRQLQGKFVARDRDDLRDKMSKRAPRQFRGIGLHAFDEDTDIVLHRNLIRVYAGVRVPLAFSPLRRKVRNQAYKKLYKRLFSTS